MYAMQYEIKLPNDYKMEKIRRRVQLNGFKTDGFKDLFIKAYLISKTNSNCITKTYSPLYLWKNSEGMNEFIFKGYYDNIISSFGWQNINIGITYSVNTSNNIKNSEFVVEEYIDINPRFSLENLDIDKKFHSFDNVISDFVIYNPDKWKCVKYSFVEEIPGTINDKMKIYEVLHVSQ